MVLKRRMRDQNGYKNERDVRKREKKEPRGIEKEKKEEKGKKERDRCPQS